MYICKYYNKNLQNNNIGEPAAKINPKGMGEKHE